MHSIENTIEKTIYIVSEVILDIGLLVAFSFNLLFGLLGDKDCKDLADKLFQKMKRDFLK